MGRWAVTWFGLISGLLGAGMAQPWIWDNPPQEHGFGNDGDCPLNLEDGGDWISVKDEDFCYRFIPVPMNWRHSNNVCKSMGTANCPAELLRLDNAAALIAQELHHGRNGSVFPRHRPIRIGARYVSHTSSWIEANNDAAALFPLQYAINVTEPYDFNFEDGETASLAFPPGRICGGTSYAEKHVFVCQSCSTKSGEDPMFSCDDECDTCNFKMMAEMYPPYAGYCPTEQGNCLLKSEVPGFEGLFRTGDPCFLHQGNRVCITSISDGVAKVSDCNCHDPYCGCGLTENRHVCMSPQGACIHKLDLPEEYRVLFGEDETTCFTQEDQRMCIFGFSDEGTALTSECDCFQEACGCPVAECETPRGKCLTQKDVGPDYEDFFAYGDPCFWTDMFNASVCIVDFNEDGIAQVAECDCEDFACGCKSYSLGDDDDGDEEEDEEDFEIHPECDMNVPPVPDCTEQREAYCSRMLSPRGGPKHTLCQYCEVNVTACGPICTISFQEQREIDYLVDLHNNIRLIVASGDENRSADGIPQPPASNMYRLVWDEELARIAQTWVDQCQDGPDENRVTKEFLESSGLVGQNLVHIWTKQYVAHKQLESMMDFWHNEVSYWPSSNVSLYSEEGIMEGYIGARDYTQLVWATTRTIGCGYVSRVDMSRPDFPYKQTLVCNYGPGGNVDGSSVYEVGPPGEGCPEGHPAEGGLCNYSPSMTTATTSQQESATTGVV